MIIADIFDREIDRHVNPAVVVSQLNSEETINQEIEEYIITEDITKNIYKFLKPLLSNHKGKTGVWINGYYGSGKSHFIKYLYYILNANKYPLAFERFELSRAALDPLDEPTPADLRQVHRELHKFTFDLDLFNIDSVSEQGGPNGLRSRITRIFLNRLNALRGYNGDNIAMALYLEKELDKKNLLSPFEDKVFEVFGMLWKGNEHTYKEAYLDPILDIAVNLHTQFDKESLRRSIEADQDFNIDRLVLELKEFLSQKPDSYRLIFLVDEVSQYIGINSNLLLNLQTIVEGIGEHCQGKVWLACTAQQELQDLVSNTEDQGDGFGKILGRFETKISLSSTDAAYITKKRILEKNAKGIGSLTDFYNKEKVAIQNQFVFENEIYKNYSDKEDFILTYPFVPYQFTLISDVFQAFSNLGFVGEGIKNTERAILGITHFTAKLAKTKPIDFFIPFDFFYNDQFKVNLTFLATQMTDRAYRVGAVMDDQFAQRVVNALFMIANLSETHSVSFPANAENLALLLLEDLETSKSEYIKRIQPVLDMLEKNHIIQLNEGKYRFLTDDEITVSELINNTTISLDDRLEYLYKDFIKPDLNPGSSVSYASRNLKVQLKVDDKEFNPQNDFSITFSLYNNTDIHQRATNTNTSSLIICLSDYLVRNNEIRSKIVDYVKTAKYISNNFSQADGKRQKTLNAFKDYNITRSGEIRVELLKAFRHAPIITAHKVVDADQFASSDPKKRYQDIIAYHLQSLFSKSSQADRYATTTDQLLRNADSPEAFNDLSSAEVELEGKLINSNLEVVSDIITQFEKPPYGWKDLSTIDMLIRLAQKKKRSFKHNNDPISIKEFAEKATRSGFRKVLTIHKNEGPVDISLYAVKVNSIFKKTIVSPSLADQYEFEESLRLALKPVLTQANEMKTKFQKDTFSTNLNRYHDLLSQWYNAGSYQILFNKIDETADEVKKLRDHFSLVEEFAHHQLDNYRTIQAFAKKHQYNLQALEAVDQDLLDQFIMYIQDDPQPWDRMPQMWKAYKEFSKQIEAALEQEKSRVLSLFTQAQKDIDDQAREKGVPAPDILKQEIAQIEKEENLTTISLKATQLADKQARAIEQMQPDVKIGKFNHTTKMNLPRVISTPEGIQKYVVELKSALEKELERHDKILLQ